MKTKRINQVRAGALVSYITIFFNVISGFIYTPWLINSLGDSDYGIYTLITSVMAYFVLDFGMGAAITRFIAKYRVNNEPEKIDNLLGVTTKLYLAIDGIILIVMAAFYIFMDKIYVSLLPSEIVKFENSFIIAGTVALLSFPLLPVNGIYTAYEKLYAQKLFDLVAKIITVVSVVSALLLGGNLYYVIFFNTFITFLVNLIKFINIKRSEKLRIDLKHKDKELAKQIFTFSSWVMIASIADRFFFTFIPSILGIVSNTTQIAIFAVAVSIENYTCLFASVLNSLFLPRVTAMVEKKESTEKITDLMIKVGRIQLIIVAAIVVLITTMGREFIVCWVGESKADAHISLIIILIPTLVHFCQAIGNEMIYATNNVKYRALVYIIGSLISTVLTFVLGGNFGAIGAAFGIGCGLLLSHVILLNIIYWKKLKLNIPRYFRECQLKMLTPMLITGIVGLIITNIYPTTSLFLFMIKAGVWALVYFIVIWFIFLNKYEKNFMLEYVNKILSLFNKKR